MKKYFLLFLLIFVVVLTACGTKESPSSEAKSESTEQTSDQATETEDEKGILSKFSSTTLAGDTADESIFADYKLTMVNIWATFCGPCIQEMPDLGELSTEYQEQGVQIVGIVSDTLNSDGSLNQSQIDTANEIVESTNATYLHLLPSKDLFSLLYQATSVPTTLFVDQEGNQVGRAYVGSRSKEDWKAIIDQLLEGVSE